MIRLHINSVEGCWFRVGSHANEIYPFDDPYVSGDKDEYYILFSDEFTDVDVTVRELLECYSCLN